jgi:hypothetical protein
MFKRKLNNKKMKNKNIEKLSFIFPVEKFIPKNIKTFLICLTYFSFVVVVI